MSSGRNASAAVKYTIEALLGLGQAEAKALVKQSPVAYESVHGAVKAIEQALHQRRQDTPLCGHRPWDRWRARSPRGKVGTQLVAAAQESPDQRLRHRMGISHDVGTGLLQGCDKAVAGNERLEKDAENAGTMLATRQAKVRKQRHCLAGYCTAESPHPDSHHVPLVWQQGLASVPTMQPKPVRVLAEGTAPRLLGQ
jgi:hypothetical protein